MDIRRILVPLSGIEVGEAALGTALIVARMWHAHLAAICIVVEARDAKSLVVSLSKRAVEDLLAAAERERNARIGAVRAMFDRLVAGRVELAPPAPDKATASFSVVIRDEPDTAAYLGRVVDLVVIPSPQSTEDASSSNVLHSILFDSGRPIILAPRSAPSGIGRRICVAWNGSAEGATALWFAIPWLKRAEAVRVLWSKDYRRGGSQAPDVVDYLALHGIRAEVASFSPVDREVGAGLLAAAREFGADLLTMGAYSHSRLRQVILGGVTRHVLENATLPVLMSR
jgi:nucleotide-binding universal stress UspA family protein